MEFSTDVDIHSQLTIFAPHLIFLIVNIFVGNLAWGVDDIALKEAFEAHGTVDSARVIHDRETGRSRGFGFVEMPNENEALKAIDDLDGSELMQREMRVNQARPRTENN